MRLTTLILLAALAAVPALAQSGNAVIGFGATSFEGVEGSQLTITVKRSGNLASKVTVDWFSSTNLSYPAIVESNGTITFEPNETTKTAVVTAAENNIHEVYHGYREASFNLYRPSAGAVLSNGLANVGTLLRITDNDAMPTVAINNVTVEEGSIAMFYVKMERPVSIPFNVFWSTRNDTARAGEDYTYASGTLSFPVGATERIFSVATIDDTLIEGTELFEVPLTTNEWPIAQFLYRMGRATILSEDGGQLTGPQMLDSGSNAGFILTLGRTSAVKETVVLDTDRVTLSLPATIEVPAGAQQVEFSGKAIGHGPVTVTAHIPPGLGGGRAETSFWITLPGTPVFSTQALNIPQNGSAEVMLSIEPPQNDTVLVALRASAVGLDLPTTALIPPGGSARITIGGRTRGTYAVAATLSPTHASRGANLLVAVDEPLVLPSVKQVSPNSGATAGGTEITLTGTKLDTHCTAYFGTRAAMRSKAINATTLTAVAPPHPAGVVAVSIACADGWTSKLNNAFTFINATPGVTSVSPSFGNVAGGTLLRITGANFLSACGVTLDGVLATNVELESPTSLLAVAPTQSEKRVAVGVVCATGSASVDGAFTYSSGEEPSASLSGFDRGEVAPGETLTIRGTRFRPSDTITIGEAPATIVRTAPEAHVVRVPEIVPGAAAVTLRDANGRISTTGPILTIVAPAAPRIDTAVVSGVEIELTGNAFRTGVPFTLGETPLQVLSLESTRALVRAPLGTAGTFALSVGGTAGPSVTLTSGVSLHSISPRCVATEGGVVVRISGSGFGAGTRVTFAGLDAAVSLVDATTLTAVVPAGEVGLAKVVVIKADGSRASLSDGFTYTSRFQPDSNCGRQRSARH